MKELPVRSNSCCVATGASAGGGGTVAEGLRGDLTAAARLFRALGDVTRLGILQQLRVAGEVCACDLVGCGDVAQPTVSHHLKVLRDAGLVESDKRGLWVYYRLNPTGLDLARRLLP